jgi:hypothetical protein
LPDVLGKEDGRISVDAEAYRRRVLWQGMERCLMGGGRGTLPAAKRPG